MDSELIYTIKAIKTTYAGVQFRSRLEATWAAFFDRCGWPWAYEPTDLEGWVPDFIIGNSILCEIKPIMSMEAFRNNKSSALLEALCHHATLHDREVLLLGVKPYRDEGLSILGAICTKHEAGAYKWHRAMVISAERGYDFCSETGSGSGRIKGNYALSRRDNTHGYTKVIWASASNIQQWNNQ